MRDSQLLFRMKTIMAIAEYDYDALGHRIYKNDPCSSTCRVYYYNDNWQILSEYDYNAAAPSQTHKYSYIYGNAIDEVVARVRAAWGPVHFLTNPYTPNPIPSPQRTALLIFCAEFWVSTRRLPAADRRRTGVR